MKNTRKYLIQIESQNMMVLDLETTQKEFNNQFTKILNEWLNTYQYNDECRIENGAKYEIVEREFDKYYETQWMFFDGTTRVWFIRRICKNGYVFTKSLKNRRLEP